MNKIFFTAVICLFASISAFGQCDDCKMPEDDISDYCFTHESFPKYCAQFGAGAKFFKFRGDKKFKSVPIGSATDLEYLKSIASNKKLKISKVDLLFIIEGLKVWEVEERKFGYTYEESGLGIKIVKEGSGEVAKKGEMVEVHYSGYLEDGTKFDSSLDRDETFSFKLGEGKVIKGWDEGLSKLKKGTVAWLRIPAELGYGGRRVSVIPANSTLYFRIEVIE